MEVETGHLRRNPKTRSVTTAKRSAITQQCADQNRQLQHTQEEAATSAKGDNWTPNKLHLIQKTINSASRTGDKRKEYSARTVLVNNRPIKFIIDTGSPVTLIPMAKFNNTTEIKPVTEKKRDVNHNNINFVRKTIAKL